MISKENVVKGLENLPATFSVDDLFDQLLLLEKIELGLKQSSEKLTFTTDEAKEKLEKWLL